MATSKITMAGATHIGGKPRNEDTFFFENFGSDAYLGVLDGHGEYGLEIAQDMRDYFAAQDPDRDLAALFPAAEAAARETIRTHALKHGRTAVEEPSGTMTYKDWAGKRQILRGGTTATLVHIHGDKLRATYAGDSEMMVIHLPSREFTVPMKDHSSTSIDEYKRILATCAKPPRVEMVAISYYTPEVRPVFTMAAGSSAAAAAAPDWVINPLGGFNKCNIRGDWSAYLRGDDESLNMTRSIGDFSLKQHGVVCTPDVADVTLRPGRSVVVTASDGLWDNFTYEAIRDIVVAAVEETEGDVHLSAADLLKKGIETGFTNFGKKGQDNTTVVLAIVDVVQEPASPASEPTDPV
jgi:serine/threonine protein phosphatase PrpC